MFIGSDIALGLGILLLCMMLVIILFGWLILSILIKLQNTLNKFLKLYNAVHFKSTDRKS